MTVPATIAPAGSMAPDASSAAELASAIERLAAARPPLVVVADFDGTLAVGARDPAIAHIEPVAQRALRRLARLAADRPGRLAVVVLTGTELPPGVGLAFIAIGFALMSLPQFIWVALWLVGRFR